MTEWTLRTTLKVGAALLGGMGLVALLPPASWLGERIQSASTGRIRLINAQGTAWFGQATVRIKERGKRPFYIQNVRWRISPLELFKDERTLQLNFAPYSGWGEVRINNAGITVNNLEFDMEPSELAKLFEAYNYEFQGKPHIWVDRMLMQREDDDLKWNTLKARLNWKGAGFPSPLEEGVNRSIFNLGDLKAQVNMDQPGGKMELKLENQGGDLGFKLKYSALGISAASPEMSLVIQLNERSPQQLRSFLEQDENFSTQDGQTFTSSSF